MADWFDEGGSGSAVDVAAVLDGQGVLEALAELVQMGLLVSLSTTSDGGALSLNVTHDGRYKKHYVRSDEELRDYLAEAMPAIRDAVERSTASNGPRKRSRRPER